MTDHNYGLPIVADNQFIKELHEELMSDRQWVIPGVKALLQFAWSLTLLILDQFYLVGGKIFPNYDYVNTVKLKFQNKT